MKNKSILFCIFLLFSYYLFCNFLDKKGIKTVANQGQWSENIINAQGFLYDYQVKSYNCILGTSLSHNLRSEYLPKNLYNLALSGQSAVDGLTLLQHKTNLPDTVFIETNFLSRKANEQFIRKTVDNRYEVLLKEQIKMFREKHVPIGFAANCIEKLISPALERYRLSFLKFYSDSNNSISTVISDKDSSVTSAKDKRREVIADNAKELREISTGALDEIFEDWNHQLNVLEAKKVVIVFYEMPIDCSLTNTPLLKYTREKLNKAFPRPKYKYLRSFNCNDYPTSDGLHLDYQSSAVFTKHLVKAIKNLN